MPRLTVLIPARNAESHLATTLRSALVALPRDAEVVVYDDDSDDGTAGIVGRFRDRRVRLLEADGRKGASGAMNHLLARTDSEFVARLDADDICLPWRFRRSLVEIERGSDVVFGTMLHWGGRYKRPRLLSPGRIGHDGVRLSLLLGNPLGHSTMLARRAVLDAGDTYQECPTEDYVLWTTLAARGVRMVRSNWPFAVYRHHGGQVTASAEWKRRREQDDAVVRAAYARLAETVTGVPVGGQFPLRGEWGALSEADLRFVAALETSLRAVDPAEREVLLPLARSRGIA